MKSLPDLDLEIAKVLQQYTEEVQEVLEEAADKITQETVKTLKVTSPKRTHKYRKAWTRKKTDNGYIIHNKRYYLTHLLEHGHARRGGGRVEGIKHIEPAEQQAIEDFEQEVRSAIHDIG